MLFPFPLSVAALSLSALLPAAVAHSPSSRSHRTSLTQRATVCNGHAELCDKSYGNVSFIGAHNSYAIGASNIATNQDQSVTTQLNDGIRMLQVQAHNETDGIHLCHSSCLLFDGGLFSTFLTEVHTWAQSNPSEVLSILIVNSDNLPASAFASVYESTGMASLSYSPPRATTAQSLWPTLGSMIESGLRVVTFMDNKANFVQTPYLIDEFANVVEDEFDTLSNAFPCTSNRTTGNPEIQLVLTNHFLDVGTGSSSAIVIPDKSNIVQTNSLSGIGSLGQGAENCAAIYQRWPNFLLVDFYDSSAGQVFQVAARLNGVSAPTNTIATYTAGTSIATSSTSAKAGTKASTSVESLSDGARRIVPAGAAGALLIVLSGTALGALAVVL